MAYPFVPAYYQLGPRKGPVKAFLIHMAEGGGTVGYLAKANPNRVSVHYVIEYGGRIVQMVQERNASGSVNPRYIRTTDDPDGFYGVTAAKAVMGEWWKDPNSALISVEIEGFARDGPNVSQKAALRRLVLDVGARYWGMGLLGHRDFADYKACPGRLIPWAALGGHGPAGDTLEDEVILRYRITEDVSGTVECAIDGAKLLPVDGRRIDIPKGQIRQCVAGGQLLEPLDDLPGDRQSFWLVGLAVGLETQNVEAAMLLKSAAIPHLVRVVPLNA